MDTAIKAARLMLWILGAPLLVSAILMCLRIGDMADAVTADAQAVPRIQQKQVDQITQKMLATIDGVSQVVAKVNTTVDLLRGPKDRTANQITDTVHEARQTMLETHRAMGQVVHEVLPKVLTSIQSNDDNLFSLTKQTTDSIKTFGEGMRRVTDNGAQLVLDADKILNDPNIPLMIASAARSAQHFEKTTENVEGITFYANRTAEHYYNVIMAPKTLAQKIGGAIDKHVTWFGGAYLGATKP